MYFKTYSFSVIQINKFIKEYSLNIGGGPNFRAIGWLNFEEQKSDININPFKLTASSKFPLADNSIKLIYSSHCLEHLDNDAVNNLFKEAHRVMKVNTKIIIKIPDFELILECWKKKDSGFFNDKVWAFDLIVPTWKNKKIKDSIDYRAAMLFCGFWNDNFGDLFSGKYSLNESAYHGPALVSEGLIRELLLNRSPNEISSELSKAVIKSEKEYHFNHVNSWNRKELKNLLSSHKFEVISFDKEQIISNFMHIPDIDVMYDQSLYCLAKKN
jgi:hypothetical protein